METYRACRYLVLGIKNAKRYQKYLWLCIFIMERFPLSYTASAAKWSLIDLSLIEHSGSAVSPVQLFEAVCFIWCQAAITHMTCIAFLYAYVDIPSELRFCQCVQSAATR